MCKFYLKGRIVQSLILSVLLLQAGEIYSRTPTVLNATFSRLQGATSGVVKDDFGNPLMGAKISVKGSSLSTVSNEDGIFTFTVPIPANSQLIVTAVGFNNAEVSIANKNSIEIQLSPRYLQDADSIILLNKTQDKKEVLQATATVYTNQLVTTPAPSFLQALPGRLSGLYTRQRSGVQDNDNPISVMDFRVRGQNPLILIDGVPREFSSIEPESIQSISVLKDALSTVMYGQRSSNNMILVTTKRPQISPFKLSATIQHGSEGLINLPKTLPADQYAILYNEARVNDGQAPAYTAADIASYRSGTNAYLYPNNDWKSKFLSKNAGISRYNVNISTGNEKARFYVALDYLNEGGFLKTADVNSYSTNTNIDRYIVRSNVEVDLNESLTVGLNIFGRIQNANLPGGSNSSIFTAIQNTPNNAYPIFNEDGSLGGNSTYSNNLFGLINNSGYYNGSTRDLSSDIELKQKMDKILPGLWAKANVSYNNTTDQTVDRSKDFAVFAPTGANAYQQINLNSIQRSTFSFSSRRTYTYSKLALGYDKTFNTNHHLSAQILGDYQATTIDLDLPAAYTNLAANASYNFKEKYFAELAGSYGGFNRYKPGNRYGLFYAAGLGWNLAKEDFLSNVKWINSLKPRISYGRTGNANVGYYVYDQYYNGSGSTNVYYFGSSATAVKGFSELTLANDNVTWEKADKLNIGVDAVLLKNYLRITSEYFNDTYSDLMQYRSRSSQLIGQSYPVENIGKNRYSGFENSISWQAKAGAVNYFVSGNAAVLSSKVVYQDEVFRQYNYQKRTGMPVGQEFGYIAEGFYESQNEIDNGPRVEGYNPVPGDLKYKDLNDDGVINQFDETAIGTQKPLVYYGLTAGFNVKGFDISVSLQGVANRDIILSGAHEYEFQNSGNGQAFEQHLYRWTPSNAANATYPRLSIGTNTNNQRNSTFWVHSADYLRLQNVDIGYTLPQAVAGKLGVNGIRIFANGFNLYSFDMLDYNDPENNNSVYPLRKTFNAGINIKL